MKEVTVVVAAMTDRVSAAEAEVAATAATAEGQEGAVDHYGLESDAVVGTEGSACHRTSCRNIAY